MKLSICYITGRADPRLEWIISDLAAQKRDGDRIRMFVVDVHHERRGVDYSRLELPRGSFGILDSITFTAPKPNIWQGRYRVTDRDWWATSNARNTFLAMAPDDFDYIAFLDDRCHLGPRWLETVRRSEAKRESVVCGSYDKLEGPDGARFTSRDHRRKCSPDGRVNCGGSWLYGCTFALPLQWALDVNGFEEGCDGLTGEDYIFGMMLANAGYRIDFVPEMFVLQDRAPGNESCKGSYACRDKGKSPRDKSHAALERFGKRSRTEFTPDLRALRARVAAGDGFPIPSDPDPKDWYDGEPIRTMVPPP